MENWWVNALWSLTPSVIIGTFFYLVIRAISRADRTERRVYKKMEDEERAKLGLPPKPLTSARPPSTPESPSAGEHPS